MNGKQREAMYGSWKQIIGALAGATLDGLVSGSIDFAERNGICGLFESRWTTPTRL